MFHRVYVQWDGPLWIGAAEYARRRPLTAALPQVTLPQEQRMPVCLTLPDGRILCDYGPEHEHDA